MKKILDIFENLISDFVNIKLYTINRSFEYMDVTISKRFYIEVHKDELYIYKFFEKSTLFGKKEYYDIIIKRYAYKYIKYDYNTTDISIIKDLIIDLKIFLEEKNNEAKELIDYLKAFDSLKNKKLIKEVVV